MAVYLRNADILPEIHKSKLSYCSYVSDEDTMPDVYAQDLGTLPTFQEMREERAKRLKVPVETVKIEDVVLRIMTYEHVPTVNKNGKEVYPRLPFSPFKHYRFRDGKWVEVLRSLWKGGIQNGSFCMTHGRLTEELGKQIMMLANRFSRKANYVGYSFRNDMCSDAMLHLVYVALKFDESKGKNPFAFFTTIINHSFKGMLSGEKRVRNTRDQLMMEAGMEPSYSYLSDHASSGE